MPEEKPRQWWKAWSTEGHVHLLFQGEKTQFGWGFNPVEARALADALNEYADKAEIESEEARKSGEEE
jgi:hypothetical protein